MVCDSTGSCVIDSASCDAQCTNCTESSGTYLARTYCFIGSNECGSGTIYEVYEDRSYYCDSNIGDCGYTVVSTSEVNTGTSCTVDCASPLLCCSGSCQECCSDADCPSGTICSNGNCVVPTTPSTETDCFDGIDNDNDGFIDFCDSDCAGTHCNNNVAYDVTPGYAGTATECDASCRAAGYAKGTLDTCSGGGASCVCSRDCSVDGVTCNNGKCGECMIDNDCGYDSNNVKMLCDSPSGSPDTEPGYSYTCYSTTCHYNSEVRDGYCCDGDINLPTACQSSGVGVPAGTIICNGKYLCDPPNGFVSASEEVSEVNKNLNGNLIGILRSYLNIFVEKFLSIF